MQTFDSPAIRVPPQNPLGIREILHRQRGEQDPLDRRDPRRGMNFLSQNNLHGRCAQVITLTVPGNLSGHGGGLQGQRSLAQGLLLFLCGTSISTVPKISVASTAAQR